PWEQNRPDTHPMHRNKPKSVLHDFLSSLALPVRRLLGIELILQNQRNQTALLERALRNLSEKQDYLRAEQRQSLGRIASLIEHTHGDLVAVKSSPAYRRCAEIVSLLSPQEVLNGPYVRIGREFDGGYVMLDD